MVDENKKVNENEEEIAARSKRMVDLFNAVIGMSMTDFPAPPFTKWLDGRILAAKKGAIEMQYEVRPEMANPTGLLHGGVQSAILDDLIGMTSATLGFKGFLISIDFKIDYLGKARVGDKVTAKAEITRVGRSIANAKAELTDEAGETIAIASSNLLRTDYTPYYNK